jgi:hypothetical protein
MPVRIAIPVFFSSPGFKLLPAEMPNTRVFNPVEVLVNNGIKNQIIFIIIPWLRYFNA